jgi:WD40 repeat protein
MCWLAIEREPTGLETLAADLEGTMPPVDLLTILRSLLRRSLVERGDRGAIFTLQPEVMDYVSGRLVDRLSDALVTANINGIAAYALLKNQSKDYVRDNQMRTIVQQVLARLVAHFGDEVSVEQHLLFLIQALREQPITAQGYAGGNIINLLVRLRGNLRGVDCSGRMLREVDLRGVNAQDSSFAGCDLGHALFTEPLETIASMALSRDGQFVAVGSFTGQIRVWTVEDGKPCWSTKGGTRMIWSLAFSPDGSMLATGDYAGKIRLWNVADGHNLRTFDGHTAWVRSVAFGPDGHTLVSAGDDETVRVWNVEDATCRHVMRGHTGLIWSAACSPDGRLVATGGSDGTVRFWDVEAGTLHHALQMRSTEMYAVVFHSDGKTCAIGGEDDLITFWDASSGQCLETIRRQGTGLASIAFNLEGTLLASGNNEGAVELWKIGGERDGSAVRALHGHIRSVSSVAFAFGGLMASTSYGGQVKIWDVGSGRCLRTIQGHSTLITACASGTRPADGISCPRTLTQGRYGQSPSARMGKPSPVAEMI